MKKNEGRVQQCLGAPFSYKEIFRKVTITSKLKLNTDKQTGEAFSKTVEAYVAACNDVSEYAFENGLMKNKKLLHNAKYSHIRKEYGLMSQMACSVFRTVIAKYETVKEYLKQNPFVMVEGGKAYTFERNLDWLQKPILFHKPFLSLVRNRDFSLCKEGISIGTLNGRVKVSYKSYNMEELLSDDWQMGGATLFCRKGTWFLHISFSKDFDDVTNFKKIVGSDRGLRFVMTVNDGTDTVFFDGKRIAGTRDRYARIRASLQSKGTKGAKRVLKRIAGRENRWMNNVNHYLSKALITHCERGTLIVIENLSKISNNEKNLKRGKKQKRELRNWSFYDLEQKLIYKAHMQGCEVIKVPPRYTSQRCPKCGNIDKSNRNRATHEFYCKKCGYRSNDDRVAAINIRELGERYLETGELKGFPRQ